MVDANGTYIESLYRHVSSADKSEMTTNCYTGSEDPHSCGRCAPAEVDGTRTDAVDANSGTDLTATG